MQKFFNFVVDKKNIILTIFILLTAFSILLIPKVSINSDMTKYLPEDSVTKKGIDIMENAFSDETADNTSFRLMITDLSDAEKTAVAEELSTIANVESVDYEQNNETYNIDNYTLYVVHISFPSDSAEAKDVVSAVKEKYSNYDTSLSGDAIGDSYLDILPKLIGIALVILLVILFILCNSWVEPVIFLATIGVAVLINMGTNIIFDSVSEITYAIAAVLQLVLSMDYSIMLLNRYRQEKQATDDKSQAMKNALRNAFTSISSSSVTTIVGMLALVFMSFTIGRDLGFVLAKGVLLSLICIFTVLPGLILIFDNLITKTEKKSLHFNMDKIASFSYKMRYAMVVFFILLFALSFFLRGNVNIGYTMQDYNEIDRVFTPENQIVILYENEYKNEITSLTEKLDESPYVNEITSYSTTLGKELDYAEMADAMEMDETLLAQMYYYYSDIHGREDTTKIVLSDFIEFLSEDVSSNEQFASFFTEDDYAKLRMAANPQSQDMRLSSQEFAAYSGMSPEISDQIFGYYFSVYGMPEDNKIEMNALIQFLTTDVASNEQFAPLFTDEVMQQLSAMSSGVQDDPMAQELSSSEIAEYFNMDEKIAQQLFNYYAVINGNMPENRISLYAFVHFISDYVANDEQFAPYFTDEAISDLNEAKTMVDDGKAQLVGENYSRLIISADLESESKETFDFITGLKNDMDNSVSGEYYILGNSAMAYEMSLTFPSELNYITILTIIAVFTVVLIAFRSVTVPVILVSLIQAAIFLTMGVASAQGGAIYYLPLLIVQCLLLGATVDYAILYTSYYRESRKTMDKKDSTTKALNNSIHTILTSALILIIVTGVLGFLLAKSDPAISDILVIIAIGGICSSALVIFVLPGIVTALDRFVIKKANRP